MNTFKYTKYFEWEFSYCFFFVESVFWGIPKNMKNNIRSCLCLYFLTSHVFFVEMFFPQLCVLS